MEKKALKKSDKCVTFLFALVLDDEDSNNITVGSLVTVLVTLTRQTMAVSIKNVCSFMVTAGVVKRHFWLFCKPNCEVKIWNWEFVLLIHLYGFVSEWESFPGIKSKFTVTHCSCLGNGKRIWQVILLWGL